MSKLDLAVGRLLYPERVLGRPRTRDECRGGARPCPYVSCRYNLYLEVSEIGSIKLNRPELEPWDMPESCALDVADRGRHTLEATGAIVNVTRERLRQLEEAAFDAIAVSYDPLQGPRIEDLLARPADVLGDDEADGSRRREMRDAS